MNAQLAKVDSGDEELAALMEQCRSLERISEEDKYNGRQGSTPLGVGSSSSSSAVNEEHN